jgi:hypothetical protein
LRSVAPGAIISALDDDADDQGLCAFRPESGAIQRKPCTRGCRRAAGNFDADLGGHVYKQRVARAGEGKSGGFRTLIIFRVGRNSFFAHGFAKSEKPNVSAKELKALKKLAEILLDLSDEDIGRAVLAGEFVKVTDNGDDQIRIG